MKELYEAVKSVIESGRGYSTNKSVKKKTTYNCSMIL